MVISSIPVFAWLIKPLIGYLIDNLLTKRTWVFVSLGLDVILVLALGLIQMPLVVLLLILVINSADAAFRDVAVDGIMCVEGKKYNDKRAMIAFFDGLIPEGWLLDIALDNWKINEKDRMELLLTVCKDCIGAVSIERE